MFGSDGIKAPLAGPRSVKGAGRVRDGAVVVLPEIGPDIPDDIGGCCQPGRAVRIEQRRAGCMEAYVFVAKLRTIVCVVE